MNYLSLLRMLNFKKLRGAIIPLVVIAAIAFANNNPDITSMAKPKEEKGFTEVKVVRVVDGDTVIVRLDNKDVKVRMIGVNTPESVHQDKKKNCKEGKIASNFTKKQLPKGKKIYLEYDKQKTDPYGRTLAYIWLSKNGKPKDYKSFCKYNYGAILLKNTYCEAVYYKPNKKYKKWYEKLEKKYQKK